MVHKTIFYSCAADSTALRGLGMLSISLDHPSPAVPQDFPAHASGTELGAGLFPLCLPSIPMRTPCKPIINEENEELGRHHASDRRALWIQTESEPPSLCGLGMMLSTWSLTLSWNPCFHKQDADLENPVKMGISVAWLC